MIKVIEAVLEDVEVDREITNDDKKLVQLTRIQSIDLSEDIFLTHCFENSSSNLRIIGIGLEAGKN